MNRWRLPDRIVREMRRLPSVLHTIILEYITPDQRILVGRMGNWYFDQYTPGQLDLNKANITLTWDIQYCDFIHHTLVGSKVFFYSSSYGYSNRATHGQVITFDMTTLKFDDIHREHIHGGALGQLHGQVYLFGGISYEVGTSSTRCITRYQCYHPRLNYHRFGPAAVSTWDRIYAIGGSVGTRAATTVEVFNGWRWTLVRSLMTVPRQFATAVSLNRQIYVIGGEGTTAVEVLDLKTLTWRSTRSLSYVRRQPRSIVYQNRIYCLPEYNIPCEVYNPVTQTWCVTPFPHGSVPICFVWPAS